MLHISALNLQLLMKSNHHTQTVQKKRTLAQSWASKQGRMQLKSLLNIKRSIKIGPYPLFLSTFIVAGTNSIT